MNRNSLRPAYSGLTGEERFRLSVRAAVSGDEAEAAYLIEGCPGVQGTVRDPSFTGPAFGSFRLTSAFAEAAGPFLGWLTLVEMLEDLLTGERGRAFLPPEANFGVAMALDRAAEAAARDLRDLIDAFEEVCAERTGLPADLLLLFWAPATAAHLKATEAWVQGLDSDPGRRKELTAHLDRVWTLQDQSKGA